MSDYAVGDILIFEDGQWIVVAGPFNGDTYALYRAGQTMAFPEWMTDEQITAADTHASVHPATPTKGGVTTARVVGP